MADVFTLLSLPSSSNAFSAFSSPSRSVPSTRDDTSRSASPPRKIARLDIASDTHTASSSSSRLDVSEPAEKRGSIVLRVVGHPVKATPISSLDADYALARRAIKVILTPGESGPLPATYDRISCACRAVVSEADKGEGLYDVVKMELERCVGVMGTMLVNDTRRSVEWLVPFTDACAWFEKQAGLLQSVLAYLDTLYVRRNQHLASIKALSYTLFKGSVIGDARVARSIMEGMSDWLDWERVNRAEHALRPHVIKLVRHMLSHGLYTDLVQATYLNLTHTFYTKESNTLFESGTKADAFIHHVQERGREEFDRASAVLVDSSIDIVRDAADNALLAGRLQWLAKDALESYMEAKNQAQLGAMYKLFAKVGGLKVLSASFKASVQKTVKGIVTDAAHDDEMVPRLLEFKAFCDKLVGGSFADEPCTAPAPPQASSSKLPAAPPPRPISQTNRDFVYGLTDAFQAGFKARRIKPAEMIAKHMDKAMRRGQKGKGDDAFVSELDEVLTLYRYTDDMDVFRTFYQRALAKRLLLGRSASDDIEKRVLRKLKEGYDPEFGMGEHMFKDLKLSQEKMDRFHELMARKHNRDSAQKLNVMVLQRSAWPFAARKTDIDLPVWMQDDLTVYAEMYKGQHAGRKLDWDHSLGTATLKARFKGGDKELSVSLYQAVILMLFNDTSELSFMDIKEQTRLDDAELQRTLQSLACGKKHRVLKKSPPGKDVNKTDTFTVNTDFTDQRYQIHINSIQSKETAEETKRTQTSIEQDRKHALDAAIVRVMKARKELMYEQLKTATIEAVKNHFVPEVTMIKQRIAVLVESEYLARDEEDMNKYIYLA